jgi:hypothetical protein
MAILCTHFDILKKRTSCILDHDRRLFDFLLGESFWFSVKFAGNSLLLMYRTGLSYTPWSMIQLRPTLFMHAVACARLNFLGMVYFGAKIFLSNSWCASAQYVSVNFTKTFLKSSVPLNKFVPRPRSYRMLLLSRLKI